MASLTITRTEYPIRRAMTVDEFDLAGRLGIYGPEEKLELIGGEVFRKMSPQESAHSTGIRLVEDALRMAFGKGFDVRVQMPLVLGMFNKPEPDVAVVVGSCRDYSHSQPTTASLVVEIADTSVAFDRTTKTAIYAGAGIEEYWILNLRERTLEVCRQPVHAETGQSVGQYAVVVAYSESESVTPLASPDSLIKIADLLP